MPINALPDDLHAHRAPATMAPATHISVLLQESIDALAIKPDGVYVDATFGRGGHSRAILAALGPQGRLIAFDRDPAAVAEAARITDPRFTIVHEPFSTFTTELDALGLGQIDGVLMDIGVSSPQLDEATRGFSFRFDAPLDMRMDNSRGQTAAAWLSAATAAEIAEVVKNYGEERFAKQIASAIVAERAEKPLLTTRQLAALVATVVRTREPGQDPATRTFQAIRIYINRELEELEITLPQALARLKPGGRLAVISFHSLEDRIVKQTLKRVSSAPVLPKRLPIRDADIPTPNIALVGKLIKAGAEELKANPRARSAVLRVAEKLRNDAHV